MRIESYFPTLEAPPGGLGRLRARLDRSTPRPWIRPAAALAALLAALVVIPWVLDVAHTQQGASLQLRALRQTLAEHRRPGLAINGQQPKRVGLNSDRVEAYFVNDGG